MKSLPTRTLAIIALVAVAVLAIGVFAVQDRTTTPTPVVENGEEQENQGENGENMTETIDTSDWQTYRNEEYGFEVKVPKEWNVEKEGNASMFMINRDPIDSINKLYFTVTIFDSMEGPISWYANNIENPKNQYNDSYKVIEEDKGMGDNTFYYLEKEVDVFEYWYIDHTYITSNENKVFMIKFREKQGPENWQYDYSPYLPTFEAFVSSLHFL